MKKALIVTVAGTATRFNRDTLSPTLKCLYHEDDPSRSLLTQILSKADDFDYFVIVGGYLFEQLDLFCMKYLQEYLSRIILVHNDHYSDLGSGYSLQLGVEVLPEDTDVVVFAEGDLFYSREDFRNICDTTGDVLTVNRDFITSRKAVALYVDPEGHPNYRYDTGHSLLDIPGEFLAVFNSAQIWKFTDVVKLRQAATPRNGHEIEGTNLEIIQRYFGPLTLDQYSILPVWPWYNCNTVADYRSIWDGTAEPSHSPIQLK